MDSTVLPDSIVNALTIVESLQTETMKRYRLDTIEHERALFLCPFGEYYVEQALDTLNTSPIFEILTRNDFMMVIVITDNPTSLDFPDYVSVVQVTPLSQWPHHETWQSRFYKWSIPVLFPNIRQSLYIDSELQATRDLKKIENVFKKITAEEFLVSKHQLRSSWKSEYDEIKRIHRFCDKKRFDLQLLFLKNQDVPESIPICQTGCLGRLHSSSYSMLNQLVLAQLHFLSSRDQLALPYAFFHTKKIPSLVLGGELMYTGQADSVNMETICFVHKKHQHKYMLHQLANTSFSWIHRFPRLKRLAHMMVNRCEAGVASISRHILRWLSPY